MATCPSATSGSWPAKGVYPFPLEDGTATGALDVQSALFEFIPAEQFAARDAQTLWPWELEPGRDYAVVLTNTSGLVRYRLDDVVRVRGHIGQTPLVEFLYRGGRVASVAGEKLTENQAVEAVRSACRRRQLDEFDFVLAPCWGDPPYYRLSHETELLEDAAQAVDRALCEQNEEYASRRKSLRLGMLSTRRVSVGTIAAMDQRLVAYRGSAAEQYKRPSLFTSVGEDDRALGVPD